MTLGDVDHCCHSIVELKKVCFDAITEYHAMPSHLRYKREGLVPSHLSKEQVDLCRAAGKRLPNSEVQVIRFPGEAVLAQLLQLRAKRLGRPAS